MQISVKTIASKIVTIDVNTEERITDVTSKIEEKGGFKTENMYIAFRSRSMELCNNLAEYRIEKGDMVDINSKLIGGAIGPDEVKAAFSRTESQMQQMQAALVQERVPTQELKYMLDKKTSAGRWDGSGILGSTRKGAFRPWALSQHGVSFSEGFSLLAWPSL